MNKYYFAGIVFFTHENIKGQNMPLLCVSQNFRRSALCKNINFLPLPSKCFNPCLFQRSTTLKVTRVACVCTCMFQSFILVFEKYCLKLNIHVYGHLKQMSFESAYCALILKNRFKNVWQFVYFICVRYCNVWQPLSV